MKRSLRDLAALRAQAAMEARVAGMNSEQPQARVQELLQRALPGNGLRPAKKVDSH